MKWIGYIKEKYRGLSDKDYYIGYVIMIVLSYTVLSRYRLSINLWLMKYTNDRLEFMNQPGSYGIVMVTAVLAGVIRAVTLLYPPSALKKQKVGKHIAGALCISVAAALVTFGAYNIHCNRIVDSARILHPKDGTASKGRSGKLIELNDEQLEELAELIVSLERVPDQEQEQLREEWNHLEDAWVWINYPETYFHSYIMKIHIYGDTIYGSRAYTSDCVYFYQDNGLIEYIETLEERF